MATKKEPIALLEKALATGAIDRAARRMKDIMLSTEFSPEHPDQNWDGSLDPHYLSGKQRTLPDAVAE